MLEEENGILLLARQSCKCEGGIKMFSKIFYSWTLNKRTFKRFTSVKRKQHKE